MTNRLLAIAEFEKRGCRSQKPKLGGVADAGDLRGQPAHHHPDPPDCRDLCHTAVSGIAPPVRAYPDTTLPST